MCKVGKEIRFSIENQVSVPKLFSQKRQTAMEREALREVLRQQLEKETGEKYEKLEDSQRLREDLALDSVDVVSLVVFLQSEFGILLESQDLEKLVNVGEFLDLVGSRIATKSAAA